MSAKLSYRHRVRLVREMAARVRRACHAAGIWRFDDLESLIKKQERQHRRSRLNDGYRFRSSVAVAVDYFIVRTFSDAFRVLRSVDSVEELAAHLDVRGDYLMALAIVAGRGESITCSVNVGELHEAVDLLDYSDDMVGHEEVRP